MELGFRIRQKPRRRPNPCPAIGLALFFICLPKPSDAWGFAAHRRIVEAAVHWLPHPLHGFFKSHHRWLKEHALDADLRKHTVEGESERHYIDLDRFSVHMDSLHSWFPMGWEEAVMKWHEDSLLTHGIGPWNAESMYFRLVYAFDAADEQRILRCAVDLAHYLGDLHVPLHTTANYNGQLSGQNGIHALWETQIPETYMDGFDLAPASGHQSAWISNVLGSIWCTTLTSHAYLPLVFDAEMSIRTDSAHLPVNAYVERGRSRQLMRSPEFVYAYHELLKGQVENRMVSSCELISSLWYSAWVEAGQPPLPTAEQPVSQRWKKALDWVLK